MSPLRILRGADVFTVSGEFICWFTDFDTSRRIRSGDIGQAARQERALCRARSARVAHFRNHEVWCWVWRGSIREGEGVDHGFDQSVAGGGLVRGQPESVLR